MTKVILKASVKVKDWDEFKEFMDRNYAFSMNKNNYKISDDFKEFLQHPEEKPDIRGIVVMLFENLELASFYKLSFGTTMRFESDVDQ